MFSIIKELRKAFKAHNYMLTAALAGNLGPLADSHTSSNLASPSQVAAEIARYAYSLALKTVCLMLIFLFHEILCNDSICIKKNT